MKKICLLFGFGFYMQCSFSQTTRFESTNGAETNTYQEIIALYKKFDAQSNLLQLKAVGNTDAGYPLHVLYASSDGKFDPITWHKQGKLVIMINNGIHPGEPDGIDASMLLVKAIAQKKFILPSNVALAIIPVYNIGGLLNRNNNTRVNQNGPLEYGFRGNAQNLDLNRDFTKCDSRNAKTFTTIFHQLEPDIFIDNHVSDGADYQHTMTLITTQYDKLGAANGKFLREVYEPRIYAGMKKKNWDLIPYVEFDGADFNKGITQFYETPRYSSGYAALFGTFAFIPETHMLKPYKERVKSTYDLMVSFIETSSDLCKEVLQQRQDWRDAQQAQKNFPLAWQPDTTMHTSIAFSGYEQDSMKSKATGLQAMFYNHNKAYTRNVKYFNHFKPVKNIERPVAYVIPAGWYEVVDLLILNGVKVSKLRQDSSVMVSVQHISTYKTRTNAYEKHYPHYATETTTTTENVTFLKGDFLINTDQPFVRYIIEMLEPRGDDSFFTWNFFDAILQQKEGYSDYRWEEVAAKELVQDEQLKKLFESKKAADPAFAANSSAMLQFIYKNSRWLEKAYLRYPVYRIEKAHEN